MNEGRKEGKPLPKCLSFLFFFRTKFILLWHYAKFKYRLRRKPPLVCPSVSLLNSPAVNVVVRIFQLVCGKSNSIMYWKKKKKKSLRNSAEGATIHYLSFQMDWNVNQKSTPKKQTSGRKRERGKRNSGGSGCITRLYTVWTLCASPQTTDHHSSTNVLRGRRNPFSKADEKREPRDNFHISTWNRSGWLAGEVVGMSIGSSSQSNYFGVMYDTVGRGARMTSYR